MPRPSVCKVKGVAIEELEPLHNFRRSFSLAFVESPEDKYNINQYLLASQAVSLHFRFLLLFITYRWFYHEIFLHSTTSPWRNLLESLVFYFLEEEFCESTLFFLYFAGREESFWTWEGNLLTVVWHGFWETTLSISLRFTSLKLSQEGFRSLPSMTQHWYRVLYTLRRFSKTRGSLTADIGDTLSTGCHKLRPRCSQNSWATQANSKLATGQD